MPRGVGSINALKKVRARFLMERSWGANKMICDWRERYPVQP